MTSSHIQSHNINMTSWATLRVIFSVFLHRQVVKKARHIHFFETYSQDIYLRRHICKTYSQVFKTYSVSCDICLATLKK